MDLEQMLAQQLEAAVKAHLPTEEMVKKADVETLFAAFKTEVESLVKDAVTKALPLDRNGVGRTGTVESGEPTLESDPCAALSRKASAIREGKEQDYSVDEKQLAAALFVSYVQQGMKE